MIAVRICFGRLAEWKVNHKTSAQPAIVKSEFRPEWCLQSAAEPMGSTRQKTKPRWDAAGKPWPPRDRKSLKLLRPLLNAVIIRLS